jgi:translin
MDLNGIISSIKEELDIRDKRRENVFKEAREIRRLSTKAIREIHKENYEKADELISKAKNMVSKLQPTDFEFSFLQEAFQEYSEAILVYSFLNKKEVPSPTDLGIPSNAYVLGMADSIGEIRRYILDCIRRDRFEDIDYFLDLMDEIYHGVMALDYPAAILPIRRKQDMMRILLEKTRGDVTIALKQTKLIKELEND